jgi:hypothetical protein
VRRIEFARIFAGNCFAKSSFLDLALRPLVFCQAESMSCRRRDHVPPTRVPLQSVSPIRLAKVMRGPLAGRSVTHKKIMT